jgi:hypothetical protein
VKKGKASNAVVVHGVGLLLLCDTMPRPKLISLQAFRRLLASPCLVPHHPLEPASFYSSTSSSCPFTPGFFFSRVSHGNDLQISLLRSCFSSKSGAAFFPGSFRHLKDFEYPHFYELDSPVAAPEEAEGEESGLEEAEGGRLLPFVRELRSYF